MTDRIDLHLDDIAVGDVFESQDYLVGVEDIVGFARQFDPQTFHTDAQAAENTFFKGLAASGWHTAAITMKLIVASVPFGSGLIGAGADIRWPTATRPGDRLRVRSEIVSITPSRSRPDQAIAEVRSITSNATGQVRQDLTSRLLVFRRRS